MLRNFLHLKPIEIYIFFHKCVLDLQKPGQILPFIENRGKIAFSRGIRGKGVKPGRLVGLI